MLANAEISRLLRTTWSADSFLAAIKEALSSTGNIDLHRLLADITAEHIEELIYLESFAKLEVINDFTMQLIRGCVEKIEKLQTLECARSHLETVIAHEKLQRESETARANKVIDNIRQCLQTLSETKCCRNWTCAAEFSCRVEMIGSEAFPSYVLRCAKCRCRHPS